MLVLSGTAAVGVVKGAPRYVGNNRWRFPLSNITAPGTLSVSLGEIANGVEDLFGNDLTRTSWSYTVDRTALQITAVSPNVLTGLPLPQAQPIVITGVGFTPQSRLTFFDGSVTYPDRVPTYVSPTELRYDIKVGTDAADWDVRVVNSGVESNAFPFRVNAPSNKPTAGALNVGGTLNLRFNRSVDSLGNVSFTYTGADANLNVNVDVPVRVPISIRNSRLGQQGLLWNDVSIWDSPGTAPS